MNDKTEIVVFVAAFFAVFGIGFFYLYPVSQEPVVVELDRNWPVGSFDVELGSHNGKTIPLLKLEHEGVNYSTGFSSSELPVDSKDASLRAMIEFAEKDNSAKTFQKFFLAQGDKVYVLYVLVKNKDVYYTMEEVHSDSSWLHQLNLGDQEEKVTIYHNPLNIGTFCFFWGIASFIAGLVILLLVECSIKRRKS